MLSVPANLLAQDAGFRELVSFIEQEWIELQGTVNVTDQLLATDPILVEKFLRATLKGFIHFRDLRAQSIANSRAISENSKKTSPQRSTTSCARA